MDSISAAHRQSRMAELRGNTVEQSAAVRKATEDKLSAGQKEFDRKHQRNQKKLDKLSNELKQQELVSLSEKVRNTNKIFSGDDKRTLN